MTIKEALDKLREYDDAYYNGTSIVEDSTYDSFKARVLCKLPDNHPLKSKVGHEVPSGWKKFSHSIFMGSQNKVCTEESITQWVSKIHEKLGTKDVDFLVQYKIDGLSLACYYNKGVLGSSVTRGDGVFGEDITANAIRFRGVCLSVPVEKSVSVRGEVVITKQGFEKLQNVSDTRYKNARNAASGISRRFDKSYANLLDYMVFDVNAKVTTEAQKIEVLEEMGFTVIPTFPCKNVDQILKIYREVRDTTRDSLPYCIDGLVLKVDRMDFQESLGVERNRPLYQIAAKFDPEGATTEIIDIILQIGRTGKFTPVAVLEPVDLDGSTIAKASLHNFDYIKTSGIGIGATVSISKRGDIIPQVEDVLTPGKPYDKPKVCPSCGSPLTFDNTNLWCTGKVCKERDVARIVYWVQTLDMRGFSDRFIEKLWDMGKLRSVSDLYKMTPDDLAAIDGLGEKTIKSFFSTLESTIEMPLQKFIVALGIPTCSKSTASILVEKYGSWSKISEQIVADFEKLPGYAKTSSENLYEGITEVNAMAQDLLKVIKIKEPKKGVLTGKSFCVTGSLESMGRKEFQEIVVENGGVAKDTVSDGLTYLVTNSPSSGSGKNQKAQKLGIKIITEKDFLTMIGGAPKKEQKDDDAKSTVKLVTENLFEE